MATEFSKNNRCEILIPGCDSGSFLLLLWCWADCSALELLCHMWLPGGPCRDWNFRHPVISGSRKRPVLSLRGSRIIRLADIFPLLLLSNILSVLLGAGIGCVSLINLPSPPPPGNSTGAAVVLQPSAGKNVHVQARSTSSAWVLRGFVPLCGCPASFALRACAGTFVSRSCNRNSQS